VASKDPRPCKGDCFHTAAPRARQKVCINCYDHVGRGTGKCLGHLGYEFAKAAGISLRGGEAA